jgi:hypothetical protein
MTTLQKALLKGTGVALMYVLAAPVLLIRWVLEIHKQVKSIALIRADVLACPYCSYENPLARMATCSKCRATEPGSVLRCSFCKTTFKTITCDQCGATLRVLRG